MADWISVADWSRSAGLARPGGAFEVKSRDGRLVAGEWSAVPAVLLVDQLAPIAGRAEFGGRLVREFPAGVEGNRPEELVAYQPGIGAIHLRVSRDSADGRTTDDLMLEIGPPGNEYAARGVPTPTSLSGFETQPDQCDSQFGSRCMSRIVRMEFTNRQEAIHPAAEAIVIASISCCFDTMIFDTPNSAQGVTV